MVVEMFKNVLTTKRQRWARSRSGTDPESGSIFRIRIWVFGKKPDPDWLIKR